MAHGWFIIAVLASLAGCTTTDVVDSERGVEPPGVPLAQATACHAHANFFPVPLEVADLPDGFGPAPFQDAPGTTTGDVSVSHCDAITIGDEVLDDVLQGFVGLMVTPPPAYRADHVDHYTLVRTVSTDPAFASWLTDARIGGRGGIEDHHATTHTDVGVEDGHVDVRVQAVLGEDAPGDDAFTVRWLHHQDGAVQGMVDVRVEVADAVASGPAYLVAEAGDSRWGVPADSGVGVRYAWSAAAWTMTPVELPPGS